MQKRPRISWARYQNGNVDRRNLPKKFKPLKLYKKIDKSWIYTHTYHWLYHFSYDSLTHLLSWRWVSLYSVYVKLLSSPPVRWSRTTEGVYFSQREREKNQNCQIEADRIEESSNGREKGRFGSLKRTHFQGPGILDNWIHTTLLQQMIMFTDNNKMDKN